MRRGEEERGGKGREEWRGREREKWRGGRREVRRGKVIEGHREGKDQARGGGRV